jgi:hypothetical protein
MMILVVVVNNVVAADGTSCTLISMLLVCCAHALVVWVLSLFLLVAVAVSAWMDMSVISLCCCAVGRPLVSPHINSADQLMCDAHLLVWKLHLALRELGNFHMRFQPQHACTVCEQR